MFFKNCVIEGKVNLNEEKDKYKDYKFTKWMTKNVGLQGIPPSAFYSDPNKNLGENFVRYCFIKVKIHFLDFFKICRVMEYFNCRRMKICKKQLIFSGNGNHRLLKKKLFSKL